MQQQHGVRLLLEQKAAIANRSAGIPSRRNNENSSADADGVASATRSTPPDPTSEDTPAVHMEHSNLISAVAVEPELERQRITG